MEIKDFIKGSLTEIVDAIIEFNEDMADKNIFVPSSNLYVNQDKFQYARDKNGNPHLIRDVEFDISVNVSEGKDGGGKFSLQIAGVNLSAGKNNERNNTAINRMKFSIPIVLPTEKKE